MSAALFLWPAGWPLALLAPMVALAAVLHERRRRRLQQRQFGARTDAVLGRPAFVRRRAWALLGAGFATMLALFQPLLGKPPGDPAPAEVVFCLDLSRSMLARDLPPDRLGRAVQDLQRFAAASPAARAGLVAFAGSAEWVVPSTADLQAVAELAATLDPSRPSRAGTDLGLAIDTALTAGRSAEAAPPVLVLLTDGEDFAAGAGDAVARAQQAGALVCAVAYGSRDGSKIVVAGDDGETFLRDEQGQDVLSVPDRAALAELAARGGGVLVDGGQPDVLVTLYEDVVRPHTDQHASRLPGRRAPHVFQVPLLLGLLLAMLALALPERRR